ncbi:MAG: diguanylate cyclase [Acidobacteria bacterium]|nr:diguanylate cyclase [Acidobacteriota bacterium]
MALFFTCIFIFQPASLPLGSKTWHTLSEEFALTQTVFAITQDEMGFLWFGTEDGMARFDGETMKNFRAGSQGLSHNFVWDLAYDPQRRIWAATNGGGLNVLELEGETIRQFHHDPKMDWSLPSEHVFCLFLDQQNRLYIGTDGGGLAVTDLADYPALRFTRVSLDPTGTAPAANRIRDFAEDDQGRMWVATDSGLFYLDNTLTPYSLHDWVPDFPDQIGIGSLLWTAQSGLYCSTRLHGMFCLKWPTTQTLPQVDPIPDCPKLANSLALDANGRIWAGTVEGVVVLENDQAIGTFHHQTNNANGLGFDRILCIQVDRSGTVWIGTFGGGIAYLDPNLEKMFLLNSRLGIPEKGIRAIYSHSDGSIWVGTFGAGLLRFASISDLINPNPAFSQILLDPNPLSPRNHVWCLFEDESGFYAGTDLGLARWDAQKQHFHTQVLLPEHQDTRGMNQIRCIQSDATALWIGSDEGLIRLNKKDASQKRFSRQTHPEIGSSRVYAQAVDDQGRRWLGSWEGLSFLGPDQENVTRMPLAAGSGVEPIVWSLKFQSPNTLWVGTNAGLFQVDITQEPRVLNAYNRENGLPSDTVYALVLHKQKLWGSTNRGLFQFHIPEATFRAYGKAEGTQSNEFYFGSGSQTPDGWLLFGGARGLNAFQPETLEKRSNFAPQVCITQIELMKKPLYADPKHRNLAQLDAPLPYTRSITMSYKVQMVAFRFAALDFVNTAKQRFAYQLEGFEETWNETQNRRFASYTNLEPGTYTFKVRATNKDGVWSPKEAQLAITIPPPFWQRLDFRIGALFLLGLIIAVLYRWRVATLIARKVQLERVVWERTEEIRRQNQDLYYTSITDPLTQVNNRRHLMEQATKLLSAAVRNQTPISLIMIDIDHFKKINDNHGHQVGDQVLIQVAQTIQSMIRTEDLFGRYGGEEFALLLPSSSQNAATLTAERIRKRIADLHIDAEHQHIRVTLSMGLSTFFQGEMSLDTLLKQADQALYCAKEKGRNQVILFEPEPSPA